MSKTAERHEFQAEVKKLLDLLVHSLYSQKDIFLRELISNASDALDKVRFEGLTNADLIPDDELHIRIERDDEARTVCVSDNGIGMNRNELLENIGTIAKSGTVDFVRAMQQSKETDAEVPMELIGQFGVGFYSSFMVADKVTVVTRRAGEEAAYKWESAGEGEFVLEDADRDTSGTTVTLRLRPHDDEDGLQDYAAEWVIRDIVKRYSDFVAYPIKMEVERDEKDEEESEPRKVIKDETLNSMKAIWTRPKKDVTEDEYKEFYKHITHDWTDPLTRISVQMEGAVEARALLYIPSHPSFDLYHHEMSYRGLQLFIKRVFIMDECKDLMPPHLRFINGVVDSEDLSLNVSRETLQRDRKITAIRKYLVKKVMEELAKLSRKDAKSYQSFWEHFGPVMKEGLLTWEDNKDAILELMLCRSTRDENEVTTLFDYVSRMPQGQDAIYHLTGPSLESVRQSPHLEVFKEKGYEVLLFTDHVDEIWLQHPPAFQDRPWKSVGRGTVDLGSEEERQSAETELKANATDFEDLLKLFKELLEDNVKEVRITNRLTSSPACLVGESDDLSPQVIAMLRHAGQDVPEPKRILEVNPSHPILQKLKARFDKDKHDPLIREFAELILGQALLAEGSPPPDPAGFSKKLAEVMEKGL